MLGSLLLTEDDTKHLKNYKLVTQDEDAGDVLNALDRVDRYALDLETTGLDWVRDTIHGICLATEDREWYVTHGAAKAIIPGLRDIANNPSKTMVGHNLKFDFHFMARHDIRCTNFLDTMIAQFMIDENQRLSLKEQAFLQLGLDERLPGYKDLLKSAKKSMKVKKNSDVSIHDIPLDILATYGARDARINFDIASLTEDQLSASGFTDMYWEKEVPFLLVLMDMEAAGMYLDLPMMDTVRAELVEVRNEALKTWSDLSNGANPNSTDQVSKYLFDTCHYDVSMWTKGNKPSVAKLALMRIQREHNDPAVAALMQYRKIGKLITTYIDSWHKKMYEGRIFGSYNQIGAKTTRLSSSNPNLQNIPAHGEHGSKLRHMISAPPGYSILVADYSQVELRLLTHYSKDPVLAEIYFNSEDVHQRTADMLGVERFQAKAVNFGWIYGMGWKSLQDNLEEQGKDRPTAKEAKQWLYNYNVTYAVAAQWRTRAINYARQLGYITTLWGKKRRLPDLRSHDKDLRAKAERQAVNAIIQGSAANIIEDAMLTLSPMAGDYDAKLNGQVHDEIVFEVPTPAVEEFALIVQEHMQTAGDRYDLRVPIVADYGIGENWGVGH